jgi:hypothetical protein
MSEQMTLLELETKPAPAIVWEVANVKRGKIWAYYTHRPSGWTIHHCGHPTANFPYYILTPAGDRILAPNGRGFQRLDIAKFFVEESTRVPA